MAKNTIKGLTVEIGGDTTKLGKALENVNKKSRDLSSELGQVNRLLKLDPGNADLLAQKQKILAEAVENTKEKLDKLKQAEKQVQAQFEKGEVSEAQYRELQREIIATEKKLDSYADAAQDTERALSGVAEETQDVERKSSDLGGTLAGVAKTGFAAVTAAVTAAVAGLVAAAESTREYRTEMGKLDAAFTASGYSSDIASAAYKELIGVIGEQDQSVEAAQQIALLANSEKDVAKWSGLAAGVVGKFGDALQPETFFESANETLKLGEATGAFTQMLEGCGYNVEKFNEGLAACSTEEEKQAYMLDITKQALGDAGEAYKENNADIIAANQANDAWMESLAQIGGAIEPVLTAVKNFGAAGLEQVVPVVEALADALTKLFNGDMSGFANLGSTLSSMASDLITKISEKIPAIAQTGMQLISGFVKSIQDRLPDVLAKGREILTNLSAGIAENMPSMVSKALDALMNFAQTLYDNAPTLIQTGFDVLKNLIRGIMDSLPALISKGPEIISKFANIINDNFPTILKKGVELIGEIIKGIVKAIPTLIKSVPKIIAAIVDVWSAFNWLNLGKNAITALKNGVTKMTGAVKTAGKNVLNAITNAIKGLPQNLLNLGKSAMSGLGSALRSGLSTVKAGAKVIFNGIVNYFKTLPSKMTSIAKDLVRGLWNGISDMTGWILDKIGGFGESVLDGIKSFFGIKSPSREMAWVGKMLDEGLAAGMLDNANDPVKAMQNVSGSVLDAAATNMNGLQLTRSLSARPAAAMAAAASDYSGLAAKLDGIYERLGRLQIVLDTGTLVGEAIDKIDAGLATRQLLSARGV